MKRNLDYRVIMAWYWIAYIAVMLLFGTQANAYEAPVKIAIIDTGYSDVLATYPLKLCKSGHYDFFHGEAKAGYASDPHGSHIGSIIASELGNLNYCAVIYQVASPRGIELKHIIMALDRAVKEKVVAVNLSIVGPQHLFAERLMIEKATARGTKVFAAAGNSNSNLDQTCNSYPGCYLSKGLYLVGALSPDGTQKAVYSNYGSIIHLWYPGHFESKFGFVQGTSYAAPRALSDYVRNLPK